jgi:4-amino-4-deoxy-L-arabinose transferase-like glycosyltransferase
MTEETPEADGPSPAPAEPAPPKFLAWLARRPFKLLALFCLVLWLPGIASLPAMDRDESRFAQSSRQMLDSGNWVDIRFGHVPRYKKPAGIYWLQAAATAVAGHAYGLTGSHRHIWTYRLPSLLGGIAAVWLTVWIATPLFGAEAAFLAGLLLAASIILTAEATLATTDAVLLACTTAMQGVLLRLYQGEANRRLLLWGWAALGMGILIKGPVAPALAATTIAGLAAWHWRQSRWQGLAWLKASEPLLGGGLALLIVLPWLVAIGIASHGAFFAQSLGDDFAAKVAGGQESHGAPPGYYLITSSLSFWPAILFVAPALALAWRRRGEKAVQFLLCWAGTWWLLVEAVPTKLPHYVISAYPPLAILAALWLLAPKPVEAEAPAPSILASDAASDSEGKPVPTKARRDWSKLLIWIAAAQFLVGLAALVAGPMLLPRLYGDGDVPALQGAAVVGLFCGLAALGLFVAEARLKALVAALLTVMVLTPTLTGFTAPKLTRFWLSQGLVRLVAKDSQLNDPPPVLAGYQEPSMMFGLGADTGLSDGKGAADIAARQGGLALIDDADRASFLARLAELQADAVAVDDLAGFNYSRGKTEHVTLYRVTALDQMGRPQPQ